MLFNLLLVLLVGSSAMAADIACPPAAEIAPCTCAVYASDDFFKIRCDASQSDGQQIRTILQYLRTFGKAMELTVDGINNTFQSVPEDFLAGNQVTDLTFHCDYAYPAVGDVLNFDNHAFLSADGTCGAVGRVSFTYCNMDHMDAGFLENCNKMTSLSIYFAYVKSISNLPRLESLMSLDIYGMDWTGSTGLVDLNISGANLPNAKQLTVSAGHLEADDVAFINDMSSIETVQLKENNFATSPDLSRASTLTSFHMNLEQASKNVSIILPTSRAKALDFQIFSHLNDIYHISTLQGFFERARIGLYFKQDSFPEALFSAPLKSGADLYFDMKKPFPCGCDIAWLVRQPDLINNTVGGMCENGLVFRQLKLADFAHC